MGMDLSARERIVGRLTDLPLHRRVFEACVDAFADVAAGVVVKGSLAVGEPDRFSDIDFMLAFGDDPANHEEWLVDVVGSQGDVLAHFAATHLDLDHLHIFFLRVDAFVVKVDVDMVTTDEFRVGSGDVVVQAPEGWSSDDVDKDAEERPDWDDLHNKFTGWVWYTYGKVARGEYFEAVDSLNVMREVVVLPGLIESQDLPAEGFRRLETRLDPKLREALERTYPSSLSRKDLVDSLVSTVELFRDIEPHVAKTSSAEDLGKLDELVGVLNSCERRHSEGSG